MTPEEYSERLTNLYGLVSGDLAADTILPAGLEMLAAIKNRIANEGLNSAGTPIGDYSTKPIYASQKVFIGAGFRAQGKRHFDGNTIGDRIIETNKILVNRNATHQKGGVFITGKQLTTSKGGNKKIALYSLVKPDYQPRKSMYLAEGYKELRAVQSLRTDIMNFKYSGNLLESYQAQLQAQEVLLGLTSELSAKKREGLETKKGRVFYPTAQEIANYKSKSQFLLTRITRNTIEGYDVTAEIN